MSENVSLALAIPSVIVPREWSYLLNPGHPRFAEIVDQARQLVFEPDRRLM